MGEADFGAVDDAVADAFDEGKEVVVFRVEDELVGHGLRRRRVVQFKF